MKSVHVTTNVVSSNSARGEMYSIQHYMKSVSVTCGRSVVFSGHSGFFHQYNWNIVESGIKHHNQSYVYSVILSELIVSSMY